jgi:hypothetical protein
MLNEKTVRATNFTCFHAGPREGWAQFRLEPPDVPQPARGKLFLRNLLGSPGSSWVVSSFTAGSCCSAQEIM